MKIKSNKNNYFLKWKIASKKNTYKDFYFFIVLNDKIYFKKKYKNIKKNKLMQHKLLKIKKIIDNNKKRKNNNNKDIINKNIINNIRDKNSLNNNNKKEKIVSSENLMEKTMTAKNKTIDNNEFDNYFDELEAILNLKNSHLFEIYKHK